MDTYKDVYRFKEIIPVSAMRKTNTDTPIRTLFQYLPEGPSIMTRIRSQTSPCARSLRS